MEPIMNSSPAGPNFFPSSLQPFILVPVLYFQQFFSVICYLHLPQHIGRQQSYSLLAYLVSDKIIQAV